VSEPVQNHPEGKIESVCKGTARIVKFIQDEQLHTGKRLHRNKVVPVLNLLVFAYNCDDHEQKDVCHVSYCAGGSQVPVPNSLQSSINALESLLAELKAKLQ
jgi:hypothetical protein